MADERICPIEGCGKPAAKLGWCYAHYYKWKTFGDPLGGRTNRPIGVARALFEELIHAQDDECIFWPYIRSPKGYAILAATKTNKHSKFASKVMCERIHGPAPTPFHQAAHSCGNGHLGCINPNHISWKTPQENTLDRLVHRATGIGRWQSRGKRD